MFFPRTFLPQDLGLGLFYWAVEFKILGWESLVWGLWPQQAQLKTIPLDSWLWTLYVLVTTAHPVPRQSQTGPVHGPGKKRMKSSTNLVRDRLALALSSSHWSIICKNVFACPNKKILIQGSFYCVPQINQKFSSASALGHTKRTRQYNEMLCRPFNDISITMLRTQTGKHKNIPRRNCMQVLQQPNVCSVPVAGN